LPRLGISIRHLPIEIDAPTKQGSPHQWKFSKVYTGPRFARCFQPSVFILLHIKLCSQQAEVIQIHENEHVRGMGQGEERYRKYKRLKLGDCQTYDRSSDHAVVVA
jgi:hypothetical protein